MSISGQDLATKIHQTCEQRYVLVYGKPAKKEVMLNWKNAEKRIYKIMSAKQIEMKNFHHEFTLALRQVSREYTCVQTTEKKENWQGVYAFILLSALFFAKL